MEDFHRPLHSNFSSATLSKNTNSKLSVPHFSAPKIDYSKIFSSFHTACKSSSSIPVLHLPPVVDGIDDVAGDAPSSILDYSEVFGGFGDNAFEVSYEELVAEKPSENACCPVELGTPLQATGYDLDVASEDSDENLSASSEKKALLSSRSSHEVFSEINVSNNITIKRNKEDSVDQSIHMAQFHKVAEITFISDACCPNPNIKYDKPQFHVTDKSIPSLNSDGEVVEGEHLKDTILHNPVSRSNDLRADWEQLNCTRAPSKNLAASDWHHFYDFGCEPKPVKGRSSSADVFVTVSDINLQTGPSRVPPPSKPPPKLIITSTDSDIIMDENMKAYPDEVPLFKLRTTYQDFLSGISFDTNLPEEASGDNLPPFFDIKIDASSAAVSSAASMKSAMESSQVRLSVEESKDKNRDNFQDHEQVRGHHDIKSKQEEDSKIPQEKLKFINTTPLDAWERTKIEVKDFPEDKRQKETHTDFEEMGKFLEFSKDSGEKLKWNDFNTTFVSHKLDERAGEWEAKQLYELVKRASINSPDNAPEWEISETKMNVTAKVHDFGLNEKAAEYVHQEKSWKSMRDEEHANKVKVANNAHKEVDNGDKLRVAQVACNREGKKKTKATCKRGEEKKLKTVEVVHQGEENDNEVEVAEKACDQGRKMKKVRADHNTSGCQENKKILGSAKHASEHTKMENLLIPAEVACMEDEDGNMLKTVGVVSGHENNGKKKNESCKAHCHEEEINTAEEPCDWEAIERKLTVPRFTGDQGYLGRTKNNIRETEGFLYDLGENKNKFIEVKDVFCWLENKTEFEAAQLGNVPGERRNILRLASQVKGNPHSEGKEKNMNETHDILNWENQERMWKESEQESKWVRKIGEKDQEWEKEKNKIPFTRETSKACDDAFVESKERQERVDLESITAEYQQTVMAVSPERMGKEPIDAHKISLAERPSADVSTREDCVGTSEERNAVDGDTSNSWDCAAEQPLTRKIDSEAREVADNCVNVSCTREKQTEDSDVEGPIAVIANIDRGFWQIPSFCDVQDFGCDWQIQSTDSSSSSIQGCSSSKNASCSNEKLNGADNESARRCQARLERHQRAIERAAKALAEKKFRDILIQREQAERKRLAETLDADVRRWSNGKEGNLRALLSTLQYILGLESGWQSIPLTDVITTAGVKKAYRKAALCVHPDKVQQRGASIQQKYICEKVYDLLKVAWNKFNWEG